VKLVKIEAARGFAAFYVFLHHTFSHETLFGLPLGWTLRFGQEAVMLFFLLSGFVINYSYSEKQTSSFDYIFNRATRIFIPLVPVLFLSYIASAYSIGRLPNIEVSELLGNLFMLQDASFLKPGVIVDPYMGNEPLWSLS